MQVSSEVVEAFNAERAGAASARQQIEKERLQKTTAQVLRASDIARRGHYGYNNGETVTYNTRWVNLAYDSDTDIATQAKLHGVYDTRLWVFPGKLACVHLYLRAAGLESPTRPRSIDYGPYDYLALFSAEPYEITVPKSEYSEGDKPFPRDGEVVQPDTQEWRELEYVLCQIEANPY